MGDGVGGKGVSMQFNVAELLKKPVGATRSHQLEETSLPMEEGSPIRVVGCLGFTRTDRGVWVQGDLEASVLNVCSRCLSDFAQTLTLSMDEQYLPIVDARTGAPLPSSGPEGEDAALRINAHHILDIQEVTRQLMVTALPLKPLCRSGCLGICLQCGLNRNEKLCRCAEERENPGLRPLLELLPGSAHPS